MDKKDGKGPIERGKTILTPKSGLRQSKTSTPPPPAPAFPPRRVEPESIRPKAANRAPAVTTYTLGGSGINALARAAGPLLMLAGRLRHAHAPADIAALRARLHSEVRLFDSRVLRSGVPDDHVQIARYALCATLDEVISSSDWGARDDWNARSLTREFHPELAGGSQFFRFLERMELEPRHHAWPLEVLYLCLNLGYEGRSGGAPRQQAELDAIRHRLSATIQGLTGKVPKPLSDHWQSPARSSGRGPATALAWMKPGRISDWVNDRIRGGIRKPFLADASAAAGLERRLGEAITRAAGHPVQGGRVDELPWLIVLGAAGAGKTSAIRQSGIEFASVPVPGDGHDCDWWITREAMLLDVAGRTDWKELLPFLASRRRRIQGLAVTWSASDLLQSDSHLAAAIQEIHRRIADLGAIVSPSPPLYLLVTKMDLLPGFRAYFADLDAGDRRQVWGVTFDFADSRSGRAVQTLSSEFDALAGRLHARTGQRLRDEATLLKRTSLFEFPQQFAMLKPGIIRIVDGIGAATGQSAHPQVRGVYFSSVPGPGTPVDALREHVGPPPGGGSRDSPGGFFIERLFREVVLREIGMIR
jgi:type IV/VI secretion system ImpK/VasF family protein